MSYRFAADETVLGGLRRIVGEQIGKAVAIIEDEQTDVHEAVHDVRKHFKKIRALVRIVRPALGLQYSRENAWYRDAAREFAEARDAAALLEALSMLQKRYGESLKANAFERVRGELRQRRDRLASEHDLTDRLRDLSKRLTGAAARAEDWQLDETGFDALAGGFRKTLKRAVRARRAVHHDATDAALHEWRKRVKYHRYHLQLLRRISKRVIKVRCDELQRLGDLLGDDHNLAIFLQHLPEFDSGLLAEVVEHRRAEMQKEALHLGGQLFCEPPSKAAKRIARDWKRWHCPTGTAAGAGSK